jgi:hypothetical protein
MTPKCAPNYPLTVGEDDEFANVLLSMINRTRGTWWDFLPMTIEPIVRRLMASPSVLERLRIHLFEQPSSSDIASLPRLMSQADGLDAGTRTWCEGIVRREMSREHLPKFGMDVSVGAIRPVVYPLLDALLSI